MVMRGTCIGLQKTVYLPGHGVYEYPYTPENFPWFYDKQEWVKYLDMMVENKYNSLYLWNGHPFASLVKLKDYPFALEVDEETFKKNEEIFSFLTHEADRRGIWVIQMFYNIILSKPFADHYGLKTQDRHRPITPLISDYTRKSIAAFIEHYPMDEGNHHPRYQGWTESQRQNGYSARGASFARYRRTIGSQRVVAPLPQHLHHVEIYRRVADHLRAGRSLG